MVTSNSLLFELKDKQVSVLTEINGSFRHHEPVEVDSLEAAVSEHSGVEELLRAQTDRRDASVSAGKVERLRKHGGCLALTASREQLACSMHRLFRDQTKLKVSG